ncbi:MAG TPA: hypothetical protein DDY20_05865 [Desulfobulbaceae bacterium]|jgi:hypothetical protein|nr:hypothetical protein [Desulfobulbaceae bacterium]
MTEQEIVDRLALYLKAEAAILEGNQSYSAGGVTYNRADLGQVKAEIGRLRQELAMIRNGGGYGCQAVVFGGRR